MARQNSNAALIHPVIVRLTHWVNAVAILVMIASGLQIYNAFPILPFYFPSAITLGGWLGGALLWHFAAMWLLMINFAAYLAYGFWSGRLRTKLWPIRVKDIVRDTRAALSGRLQHGDLSRYNAVQKLLYAGVLLVIAFAVASGFVLWKPVQLQFFTNLMGGFEGARIVHFGAMVLIVGFLFLHVVMALLVPRTIRAMIIGR